MEDINESKEVISHDYIGLTVKPIFLSSELGVAAILAEKDLLPEMDEAESKEINHRTDFDSEEEKRNTRRSFMTMDKEKFGPKGISKDGDDSEGEEISFAGTNVPVARPDAISIRYEAEVVKSEGGLKYKNLIVLLKMFGWWM